MWQVPLPIIWMRRTRSGGTVGKAFPVQKSAQTPPTIALGKILPSSEMQNGFLCRIQQPHSYDLARLASLHRLSHGINH